MAVKEHVQIGTRVQTKQGQTFYPLLGPTTIEGRENEGQFYLCASKSGQTSWVRAVELEEMNSTQIG